jgi:RNA polymerase sigma-70 factor (ECF subfamily)
MANPVNSPEVISDPVFATTRWSQVICASRNDSPQATQALNELCRVYWYPLYAYVRRQGFDLHTAQDLTQGFFAKLLEKNYLSIADRKRGRFRWFLLTAFKCFLANEWDRTRAQRRGGGARPLSLDAMTAEERYRFEPADTMSADQLYDRRWALDLLDRARDRLRADFAGADKTARFACLEGFLPGGKPSASQGECAQALGLTENAVKQDVHRMKRRFGELLREEVAHTVAHPDEVVEELRYLIDVVCRR